MILNTATITQAQLKECASQDLLDTYNKITGESVKKFADRATAERRTWKVIGQLAPGEDINKPVKTSTTIGKRDSSEGRTIKILIAENKKRPGSRAHAKYAILLKMDGKTIKDFKKEEGKHPELDTEEGWPATELRWATKLSLVKIINGNSASKAA